MMMKKETHWVHFNLNVRQLFFCAKIDFRPVENYHHHLNLCRHKVRSDPICALQNMELIEGISGDQIVWMDLWAGLRNI